MASYTNAVRTTAYEHNVDELDLLDAVENASTWSSLLLAVMNRINDPDTADDVMDTLDAYGLYYEDEQPAYRA